jgi:hypothetical protein
LSEKKVYHDIIPKEMKKTAVDQCPECKCIVRIKQDPHHAEQLCDHCGCVIREKIPYMELSEIHVTDRELEIELNTWNTDREGKKTRRSKLIRFNSLMERYDRKTEGNNKKWRNGKYKDYVGIVSTHFMMTKLQKTRVFEMIDDRRDIKDLHRKASYEQIVTSLCIISMKKDKRRIGFNDKSLTAGQKAFIGEIGLTEGLYLRVMEKIAFPAIGNPQKKKRYKGF